METFNNWVNSKGKTASPLFVRLAQSQTRTLKADKYECAKGAKRRNERA